ncbi:glycosyltransferase family 2 protein [Chromobacterium vaccinii]|uniref:glycosyltransferase family 2 protein n=1 Tax=Chromobacterium vaccinii TaxID=1108595 RepID=UPI000695FF7C|nr:glycosyltransferase family 2 protein [Chromobacterium vaccinii]
MTDARNFVPPYLLELHAAERPADPLVSCLIPAYNESENITPMLETLHRLLSEHRYRHELVVVDDGSRDDTVPKALEAAKRLPVTVIQLSRNFGKEIALTAGIDNIGGDVAVLIDGDFQHPPEMVPVFLAKWREGYDMVYSVRANRDGETLAKRAFTRVFYALLNSGAPLKIPENTQDFRVLDKSILEALRRMPERNRFMKGLYNWVGFTQLAMETQTQERRAGKSSFNFRSLFNLGLTGLTAFSNMPLRIWTLVGCVISMLSIGYAIWELVHTLLFGNPVSGWPTLAVAVTFLGGVQLLSIGILGEYVGRIFNEVKGRPTYLISRISKRKDGQEA